MEPSTSQRLMLASSTRILNERLLNFAPPPGRSLCFSSLRVTTQAQPRTVSPPALAIAWTVLPRSTDKTWNFRSECELKLPKKVIMESGKKNRLPSQDYGRLQIAAIWKYKNSVCILDGSLLRAISSFGLFCAPFCQAEQGPGFSVPFHPPNLHWNNSVAQAWKLLLLVKPNS